MCSTVILWHCRLWHHYFFASVTCEAIPFRSQIAITQGNLSLFPNALDAAPRLVDLFVSRVATTVVTIYCLAYADVQVDSDQKETQTSRLTEAYHVRSWLSVDLTESCLKEYTSKEEGMKLSSKFKLE